MVYRFGSNIPGEKSGKINNQMEMNNMVAIPYIEMKSVLLTGISRRPYGRKILRNRKTNKPKVKEIKKRAKTEDGNRKGLLSQLENK
jgi:hypothetical protein